MNVRLSRSYCADLRILAPSRPDRLIVRKLSQLIARIEFKMARSLSTENRQ